MLSEDVSSIAKELNLEEDATIDEIFVAIRKLQAKANKYDSLAEKIKEKIEELENKINKCKHHKHTVIEANIVKYELQKLLDTEK